jgi:type VII secretion protein EccB
MARQSVTKLQVSGYRFLMRRMEHALVRGDIRMLDDPLRAQSFSLVVGCVLAVIAVAACAILAFLQPRGALGTAPIVMARESGALYVRIDDAMHPVLNLSSARLITGATDKPQLVRASAIERAARGPTVGIPGAPDTIGAPMGAAESDWTVCEDATATTTLIAGAAPGGLDGSERVLVTPRGENAASTYLLYDGRRAKVDLRNQAVVRALQLDDVAPRPVSRALLDALPEAPEITVPAVAGAGAPSILPEFPVGTVVRLARTASSDYYVFLSGGVQRVGEVAADLIRFTQPDGRRDIASVAPALIGALPNVDELPVATYPVSGGVADFPVLCTRWWWSQTADAVNTAVLTGHSRPTAESPTFLAQADGAGAGVDNVVLPRGASAYVRAAAVTGDGAATGPRYLISDAGVAFGIHDDDAATRLGLTTPPVPAPWPVLARLPRGPELSVESASVERDSVGSPS